MFFYSEKTCAAPDVSSNTARGSGSGPYTVGDIANYTCRTGYIRSAGNVERRCLSNESWSGSALQCESELIRLQCFTLHQATAMGLIVLTMCMHGFVCLTLLAAWTDSILIDHDIGHVMCLASNQTTCHVSCQRKLSVIRLHVMFPVRVSCQ